MYKSKWPLFKVLHRAFRFVNATQKVRRATTYIVQVPRARRDRKHYDIAKNDRLTFKTNILLAFLNQHSTQYHNTILARRIKRSCEVAKTGDTSSFPFFSSYQSTDSAAWTWFYTGFQLSFTEMCECLLYTNDHVSASHTVLFNIYASYV